MAQGIGDDEESVASSSLQVRLTEEGFQPVYFDPRELKNLALIDEMESLCPLMDIKVQMYCTNFINMTLIPNEQGYLPLV